MQETASLTTYQRETTASVRARAAPWMAFLLIVVLAALPRLTDLDRFLIVDEPGRWEWAKQFFSAVVSGNPGGTMIHGYPGVLPNWFSFGWIGLNALWQSIQQGSWLGQTGLNAMFHEWDRVPQHLADQRLGVVAGNTVLVLLSYLLIRRAFGAKIAVVSSVLIALDPFLLSDSRVNRAEAVTAGVTFVSLLLFIVYTREGRRHWLILSGVAAGLACLAKIQAVLIVPIVGLIALGYHLLASPTDPLRGRLGAWVRMMVYWGLALVLAFWLVWPAMWVAPVKTLQMVYNYVTEQSGAEGVNLFFLGQVVRDRDPGPLFYPLAFALRVSPLVLLGLGVAGRVWWQQRYDRSRRRRSSSTGLWLVAAFALIYPIVMTLGGHKQDRYLMTIFPMVDLLAALGLIWLWERVSERYPALNFRSPLVSLGALIAVQLLLMLPYHPYYFQFFNPLAGGSLTAPRLMRIGWGEGLDQVATFLNRQPNPERLTVASRFPRHLVGFTGAVVPLDAGGAWTRADYLIFYIHQLQRQQDPGPGEIRWLRRYQPEYVVRLGGIEYAAVYQNPIDVPAKPQLSRVPGQVQFFGYIWEDDGPALRLVWRNELSRPDQEMWVRLKNGQRTSDWLRCQPGPEFDDVALKVGEVVESRCLFSGKLDLAAGLYDLDVGLGLQDAQPSLLDFPEGRASLSLSPDGTLTQLPLAETLAALARAALPATATELDTVYGQRIRLAGYELTDREVRPGETIQLELYWQARTPLDADYTAFAHLFGPGEGRLAGADVRHGSRNWLAGAVQPAQYSLTLSPDSPAPAIVRLDVGLYDDDLHLLRPTTSAGQPLPWTLAYVKVVPAVWPTLQGVTPAQASFDTGQGSIALAGYSLLTERPQPGETIDLTLYWQPQSRPEEDYTVFAQVLDPKNQLVAQDDGPPRGGDYPTSHWAPGETIADLRPITLPVSLAPGTYRLLVGLYRLEDGWRLPVRADSTLGPDALILATMEIGSP